VTRTLRLTLSYDGTRFVGWQRQAEGESIQGLLEDALARFEGAAVTVHGAGRTDAGVHALGQVASVGLTCSHSLEALLRGLNASLPPELRVVGVEEAPSGFHARFSARSKTYRYQIRNASIVSPFELADVWHVPEPLDVDAMQAAAAALVGTHDFAAFASAGGETKDTTRTITRSEMRILDHQPPTTIHQPPTTIHQPSTTIHQPSTAIHQPSPTIHQPSTTIHQPGLLSYEVAGTGFLRYMVRAIVGTLVEIGRGRRPPTSIAPLIAGGTRADAGATAPPHGLFLVRVDYD